MLWVVSAVPDKPEDKQAIKAAPAVQAQTKDDAYDTFMQEMQGFLSWMFDMWVNEEFARTDESPFDGHGPFMCKKMCC